MGKYAAIDVERKPAIVVFRSNTQCLMPPRDRALPGQVPTWLAVALTAVLSPLLVLLLLGAFMNNAREPGLGSLLATSAPSTSRFLVDTYPARGPIAWDCMSKYLKADYSMNGNIHVSPFFIDGSDMDGNKAWPREMIDELLRMAATRDPAVGHNLSVYGEEGNEVFFAALAKYPLDGLSVLVVGSEHPWVEALCLSFGAKLVTTVDFNVPTVDYPKVRVLSIAELDNTSEKFDAIFSYSSLEHDGLGRYGDPLNPNGDLERMKKLKTLLKLDGRFYLGVPTGPDALIFNAHRIYGPIRFPMLIEGWNLVETFGTPLEECYQLHFTNLRQPLNLLTLSQG